jgi:hypothetical protein
MRGCWARLSWTCIPSCGPGVRRFPISQLDSRLKCPMCRSGRVALIFDLPKVPVAKSIAGVPSA